MRRREPMTREELEALPTHRLNSLRKAIYKCGWCNGMAYSGRECYHPHVDLVKEILNTREHVPKRK
jgi:hypothetical protein